MASLDQSNMPIPLELGPWLRCLRTEKKLVLRQVAAAVDMDMAHLSKVELGDRLPTQEQATALAHFYGIPPDEIEAARMAGKFLRDLRGHPAASRAIELVQESAAAYGIGKSRKNPRMTMNDSRSQMRAET